MLQAKQLKLAKELSSIKHYSEKTRDRVRLVERVLGDMDNGGDTHTAARSTTQPARGGRSRGSSRSKSATSNSYTTRKQPLRDQVAVLIDGLGALQN